MDLFTMFEEPKAPQKPSVDLVKEFGIILQQHGIDAPEAVLRDLASYYIDPPPWAPW